MNDRPKLSAFNSGFHAGPNTARLHLNENPYEIPGEILAQIERTIREGLGLYPDSECDALRQSIADYVGVPMDMIAVGNGVDELIMLLTLTYARDGKAVVFTDSTFPGYKSAATIAGARQKAIPLANYSVDSAALISAMDEDTAISFVCNPLNPTGSLLKPDETRAIMDATRDKGVIPVFDEAYIDYVKDEASSSALKSIAEGGTGLVLRTFSKAWGLASLRIGFVVGPAELIEPIWQTRNALPFNVNRIAQSVLPEVLRNSNYINDVRNKNHYVRSVFCERLDALNINYRPSEANFVMVSAHGDSTALTEKLARRHDILVRDLALFGIPGWLRVSVGTNEEMSDLAKALETEVDASRRPGRDTPEQPHWDHATLIQETMVPAQIFNGFAASHAIQALEQMNIWDRLSNKPQSSDTLCAELGIPGHLFRGLIRTVALVGLVEIKEGLIHLTETGQEAMNNIGYFTWGVGGYGRFLQEISEKSSNFTTPVVCQKNGELIAKGAGRVGKTHMLPIEQEAVRDIKFNRVADIGCGDGSRLIRLMKQNDSATAVGIDINTEAVLLARAEVEKAGFANRIQIHQANILDALQAPEFKDVDLVCCFLMMHDLFAASKSHVLAVRALRSAFPDAKDFLIADTVRQEWDTGTELPMFSLQFELVHALSNTPLHSLDQYIRSFEQGEMSVKKMTPFGAPSTWLFHLTTAGEKTSG